MITVMHNIMVIVVEHLEIISAISINIHIK